MRMLVGYTGFVGSNICNSENFDYLINSKNIESAFGKNPDLLIYSGVPAEMFIANKYPEQDKLLIEQAQENIKKIGAKTTVLISTVAVYDKCTDVDEDYISDLESLTPYGRNRLLLEEWVQENCENYLIVRLPAIFGINLKKNFLYDFINYIPPMLKTDKYNELSQNDELIKKHYEDLGNGFFKCTAVDKEIREQLKLSFKKANFSALNFTDSRSFYQFFSLEHLYKAIRDCLDKNIRKINLVTPPISVGELYKSLTGEEFTNILDKPPFDYDIKTKYTESGYIMSKEKELSDIKKFINANK